MKDNLQDKLIGLILFFVSGIIPLVTRLAIVPVNSEEASLIRNSTQVNDIFSYCKSWLIIISAVVLVLIFIYNILSDESNFKFELSISNIAMLSYVLFVLLSTVLSNYKVTALSGASERYESLFILLAYVIFFYAAKSLKHTDFIVYGLMFSAIIIGFIGLFQFIGKDFFVTTLGKKLLLGAYGSKLSGVNIRPVFDTAYATLYNPNCLGLYSAFMFPIALVLGITRNKFKYIFFAISLLMFINVFAAKSTGGLIGLLTGIAILIGVYFLSGHFKILCGVFVIAIACIFVSPIRQNLFHMINKAPIQTFFTDLSISNTTATISTKTGNVSFTFNGNENTIVKAEDKTLLPTSIDFVDEKRVANYKSSIGEFSLQYEDKNVLTFKSHGVSILFAYYDSKLFLLSNKGELIANDQVEKLNALDGFEFFASSRGYIWSRSIPLIKHSLFIGSGPDTFVFKFPQQDIIGKLKFLASPYIIVDKPHNFYLQTIINTGFISLCCLLIVFGNYILITLKDILKSNRNLNVGLLCGIISYLIASFATDSVVSVAPIFWITLGLAFNLKKGS